MEGYMDKDDLDLKIEDLIGVYPLQDDPDIQQIFTSFEEFAELAPTSLNDIEKVSHDGVNLFKHQELFRRFVMVYQYGFLMFAPGTGKSLAMISGAEYYRKVFDSMRHVSQKVSKNSEPEVNFRTVNNIEFNIKKVVVIVKGSSLKRQFVSDIFDNYNDIYNNEFIRKSTNPIVEKSAKTKSIKKWYNIVTYIKFGLYINENKNNPNILDEFNDTVFFLDEVHNLNGSDAESEKSLRSTYQSLHFLLHRIRRSKVFLSSATPMINSPDQLKSLMNLILPLNNQMPSSLNMNRATLAQLEPYFRGKLFYMKSSYTGIKISYKGVKLDLSYEYNGKTVESQMIVTPVKMSKFQENVYKRFDKSEKIIITEKELDLAEKMGGKGSNAFYRDEKYASTLVWPDGTIGGMLADETTALQRGKEGEDQSQLLKKYKSFGLGRYVVKIGKDEYKMTNELKQAFGYKEIEKIRKYSAKNAFIINNIIITKRKSFCYHERISGAGVVSQAMCFEAMGFERYTGKKSAFTTVNPSTGEEISITGSMHRGIKKKKKEDTIVDDDDDDDDDDEVVEDDEKYYDNKKINIGKKERYILYTRESGDAAMENLLKLFNSKENMHGDYVRVFIGSRITRDGINLKNTLDVYLITPDWHESGMFQAISRIIRAESHKDLIDEKIKNGEDPLITVGVYKMDAITSDGHSTDTKIYKMAEIKDRNVKRVERILLQTTLDCYIHEEKNYKPENKDYSAACFYDVCKYPCFSDYPDRKQYETYDILFIKPLIDKIVKVLSRILEKYYKIELIELYKLIPDFKSIHIIIALEHIIDNNILINNRFNGKVGIEVYHGIIYSDYDYFNSHPYNNYYTTVVSASRKRSLYDYIDIINSVSTSDTMEKLKNMENIDSKEFSETLFSLTKTNLVKLFEELLTGKTGNEKEPWGRKIIDIFSNYYFASREPIVDIERSYNDLNSPVSRRGRKRDPDKIKKYEYELEQEDPKNQMIFFHILNDIETDKVAYAVSSLLTKMITNIRVFVPNDKQGWRDAYNYEVPVYNAIKQRKFDEKKEGIAHHKIYGTVLTDGKFRIVDTTKEDDSGGTKSKSRGKICTSYSRAEILKLLAILNIKTTTKITNASKDDMIEILSEHLTIKDINSLKEKEIKIIYQWIQDHKESSQLCLIIKKHFEENEMILTF